MSKVKDRLNEIRQIQNDTITIECEDESKHNNSKGAEKKETKMKKTLSEAENIMQLIKKIEQNTHYVQDLMTNRHNTNSNFYETKDTLKEINEKFKESASIALKAANKLKEFNMGLQKFDNENSAKDRIKLVQYNSLNQQLQNALKTKNEVMEKIRDIQKYNLKAEINIVRRKQNTNYADADDEEIENLLHDNKPIQIFTDNILMETEEAKQQLAQLEERHQEFLKIEEQLVEIRDLFVQMGLLVEQQQDQLNRVEYHANSATRWIEKGQTDLGKAQQSKRKHFKRKIYLILILILVFIIIILIMFH